MIEKEFWEDVRNAWILKAPPQIRDAKISSGGEIDPDLLQNPWDMDGIPFDMLDFDQAVEAGLTGIQEYGEISTCRSKSSGKTKEAKA